MTKKTERAERQQLEIFYELATGYQRSKVLFTFVELGIADWLELKPQTAAAIAKKIKIDSVAAASLLNAAAAIGLVSKRGEFYANQLLSKMFLHKKSENYLGGQINRFAETSYPLWDDLTRHLKGWKLGDPGQKAPAADDQGAKAMADQHPFSHLHGRHLAAAFDFSKYRKILDLGGGTGAMAIALCEKYPRLEAVVYDFAPNIKMARKFVKKSGLTKRIELIAGDLKKDELPSDFDAVLLANFMSVADREENLKTLKKLNRRLPAGGLCLISGLILGDSRMEPAAGALFCLEDICRQAPDVEKSEKTYAGWLRQAGFNKIKSIMYLPPTSMLYGFKKSR